MIARCVDFTNFIEMKYSKQYVMLNTEMSHALIYLCSRYLLSGTCCQNPTM